MSPSAMVWDGGNLPPLQPDSDYLRGNDDITGSVGHDYLLDYEQRYESYHKKEEKIEFDARLTISEREILQTKDFAQMSAQEIMHARILIDRLVMPDDARPFVGGAGPDVRISIHRDLADIERDALLDLGFGLLERQLRQMHQVAGAFAARTRRETALGLPDGHVRKLAEPEPRQTGLRPGGDLAQTDEIVRCRNMHNAELAHQPRRVR